VDAGLAGGDGRAAAAVNTSVTTFPARLLVDLPNWLGDVVHAVPALDRLREANRGGRLEVLAPEAYVPLLATAGLAARPRPRRAAWRWARHELAGRWDVALTARHSTRAKLLLAGCGARLALASAGRGAAALGLATFPVDRARHQRHDLDGALRALGVPAVGAVPGRVELDGSRRVGLGLRRALAGATGPLVTLFPATRSLAAKRYPAAAYADVGRRLAAAGCTVVVTVGPGEEELGHAVAARCGARALPTAWPLDHVAGLLAACDAAVGNDSGLTHLAALVGCRTVALFGPTDPARTAPGSGAVLREPTGWPEPARVAAAVTALLEASPRAAAPEIEAVTVAS